MRPPFTAWFTFLCGMHHDLEPPALPLCGFCLPDQTEAQRGRSSTVLLTLEFSVPGFREKDAVFGGCHLPGGVGFFTWVRRQWPGSP